MSFKMQQNFINCHSNFQIGECNEECAEGCQNDLESAESAPLDRKKGKLMR